MAERLDGYYRTKFQREEVVHERGGASLCPAKNTKTMTPFVRLALAYLQKFIRESEKTLTPKAPSIVKLNTKTPTYSDLTYLNHAQVGSPFLHRLPDNRMIIPNHHM